MPAVRVLGLPPELNRKFARACEIAGSKRAAWLLARIRLFVLQAEQRHGDLFDMLNAEEQLIIQIVASGAAEKEHIAAEANMDLKQAVEILRRLVERQVLITRPKGGKTDCARGAKVKLYFVAPGK